MYRLKRQCTVWLVTLLIAEAFSGLDIFTESSAYAETKIIPSITVSERYDSNVWFVPPELIPPGKKSWDFVTAVSPEIQIRDKNREADTTLRVGVGANAFVNNSEFSFIQTEAAVSSDVSGWIGNIFRGTRLRVTDFFRYTPEPPGFLTGVPGSGPPSGTSDAYSRGIVGQRANTWSNSATISGDYALSRGFGLRASYNNAIFRVGQLLAASAGATQVPLAYFNTIVHSWSAGSTYTLTRGDSLSFDYQGTHMDLSQSGGGGTNFRVFAQGFSAEYLKVTPDWKFSIGGGPTVLENDLFFSGKIDLSERYDPSTTFGLRVSRQAAPATYGTGGALISTIGSTYIVHKLYKDLTLVVSANYAYNVTAPVDTIKYESYSGEVKFVYPVTPTIVTSLAYEYNNYNYSQQAQELSFNRNVVTFAIASTWK